MIPPLQPIRLRSISRWMQDHQPTQFAELSRSGDLERRVSELDAQMVEAFETREDSLKDSMMKSGTWGTAEGLASFPLERMELWQETVAEFLPATTDPASAT
jgi:hypothetical protein